MRRTSRITALLILFLNSACDPGIRYEPKGWNKVSESRWSKSFGQIDVETGGLGGLIGETWLNPEISIRNRAKSQAVVERAVLKTGDAEYAAPPPSYEWGKWEVPPGGTQRLDLEWEFENDKPIYKVLKDPVEVILRVRVGAE